MLSAPSIAEGDDALVLASLMDGAAGHVSVAVSLEDDPEPVVGSFTVDGMTFAVVGEGKASLVAVGSSWAEGAGRGIGSGVPTSPQPQPAPSAEASASGEGRGLASQDEAGILPGAGADDGSSLGGEGGLRALFVPEVVEHGDAAYVVASVGPRALAGCDAYVVTLPASVASVDELAFRGSAVASVEVADGNVSYSSYDGMLFDAEQTSLLLIPEGKQGAALIPQTAESVPPSAFSHCALVTSVSVDEGSADLSSRNGCLYDASGETLLRVPAGAEGIDIADGCMAVAPGALEGCARLRSIQAPASVAEVSLDVLGASAADAASLPAGSLAQRETGGLGFLAGGSNGLPSSDEADGSAAGGSDGEAALSGAADDVAAGNGFGSADGTAALPASTADDAPGPVTGDGVGGGAAAGEEVPDGFAGTDAEAGAAEGANVPAQLTSLVALSAASDGLPQVDPASVTVRLAPGADPAPWEAAGFAVEVAEGEGSGDAAPEASSEGLPGEPLGALAPDDGYGSEADDAVDGPVVVDEVAVAYGYANERSSANGAYERALPKVDAVLRLQPVTAEDLAAGRAGVEGDGADAGSEPATSDGDPGDDGGASVGSGPAAPGDGSAASPTLASGLADLPEESQATASFLYEGCLYVIDPEGGAALVAVDKKRLAECVEDPTTLILPDYVDDGTWSYRLTRIAKGAFRGSGIERLWIPASATYLDYALEGCETLRYVEISEDSPVYSSKDGCLYDKAGEVLWMMPEAAQPNKASYAEDERELIRSFSRDSSRPTRYPLFLPEASDKVFSATSLKYSAEPLPRVNVQPYRGFIIEDQQSSSTWDSKIHYAVCGHYLNAGTLESSTVPLRDNCVMRSRPDIQLEPENPTWNDDYAIFSWPDSEEGSQVVCKASHNGVDTYFTRVTANGQTKDIWLGLSVRTWWTYVGSTTKIDDEFEVYQHPTMKLRTSPDSPDLQQGTTLSGRAKLYWVCSGAPVPSTLHWDFCNGDPPSSVTANFGSTAVAPGAVRPGYTLEGWYTAASGGSWVCGPGGSVTVTGDATYYAHWTPNPYTINYHSRSGTYLGSQQATYDQGLSLWGASGGSAGYTANGWATSAWQGSGSYGLGAWVSNLATGGAVDLYLAETANTYTIRYHDKAGNHLGDQGATYDQALALWGDPNRTGAGYTAQGWARSANQTARAYAFGQSASNLATGGSINLYVAETANTYNVRYFDKAGNHIGTDQKPYDAWFNLRGDPGRTHPAYTARGWARSANQTAASHAFALWTRNLASAQGANFDLYVAETANEYSISYDAAGGTLSGQRTSYTFETADFRLAEPTRTGYTFTGWKVTGAAEGSAGVAVDGVHSTVKQGTWGNLSCVATWHANEYAVALDAAFPEFATSSDYEGYAPYGVAKDAGTASVTATFDSAMPAATMPKATGYSFEGYFDDAGTCYYNADGSSARAWDKPNGATLHGRWSVERHELTLDVGNGEVPSAAGRGWSRDEGEAGLYRLTYSIEWVEESGGSLRIQLPVPAEKPGYESFEGWVGPNLSKPSTVVQVQPWELADKAYSGVFSGAIQYSASLDLAGGSFAEAPEGWAGSGGSWSRPFNVESDAFGLPTPERHGYGFEGWAAVAADGSLGEPAKDVTVPKGSWGDRAWRAAWKAVSYSISYDLAGGAMSGQRESYTMEDPDFDLPVPAREGYSFQGWEVEGANGAGLSQQGVVTTVRQGTWGDLSCTARWAAVSYAVALSLEGGSFATAPDGWSESGGTWTRAFTVESEAFQLPTPTRPGHDFQGWALVAADGSLGSPAASVAIPKGTVGDRSYRAVWQARTYVVTWHYSGQVIDGRQSVTADQAYGSPIAFPSRPSVADPARDHYSFAGWFTAQEGGERVQTGDYLLESDATFYARWSPVEYVVHLHLGDDDAHAEHKAAIEQGGVALPMAPDGHFDLPYTVEDEVSLPTVSDDPGAMKPVREGMSFVGWVECAEDGSFDSDLVPSIVVTLPKGSHGDRHFRALWSFALRFEVPSAVSFRFDLADDPAFADAPYGPVAKVEGEGVELRSLSLGRLAVADVALDVAGARPDDIVADRSKVSLRVMDATLSEPWRGWVPLPTTSAPERLDPFDLDPLGFGEGNAVEPLSSKPLRYEVRVNDADTTLAGEVDGLPLAKVVFTVKGLW